MVNKKTCIKNIGEQKPKYFQKTVSLVLMVISISAILYFFAVKPPHQPESPEEYLEMSRSSWVDGYIYEVLHSNEPERTNALKKMMEHKDYWMREFLVRKICEKATIDKELASIIIDMHKSESRFESRSNMLDSISKAITYAQHLSEYHVDESLVEYYSAEKSD